jgi:hypothetical protein
VPTGQVRTLGATHHNYYVFLVGKIKKFITLIFGAESYTFRRALIRFRASIRFRPLRVGPLRSDHLGPLLESLEITNTSRKEGEKVENSVSKNYSRYSSYSEK